KSRSGFTLRWWPVSSCSTSRPRPCWPPSYSVAREDGMLSEMGARRAMYALERRYLFTGRLVLDTGLHVGGGSIGLSPSDSPIVRTPTGAPYIPGSGFKGAFRSTVEKLAGSI